MVAEWQATILQPQCDYVLVRRYVLPFSWLAIPSDPDGFLIELN